MVCFNVTQFVPITYIKLAEVDQRLKLIWRSHVTLSTQDKTVVKVGSSCKSRSRTVRNENSKCYTHLFGVTHLNRLIADIVRHRKHKIEATELQLVALSNRR